MTGIEQRASLLIAQFLPLCDSVNVISLSPEHWQFRIRRKVSSPPSTLFGDGETRFFPFDEWCSKQGDIEFTSKGRFRLGLLKDGTKITIRVDQ